MNPGANVAVANRPPASLPLTIVTGFPGAGKTHLLNSLLRDPALADTLVIINEFGEVGLDRLLIEPMDGEMLVITAGCCAKGETPLLDLVHYSGAQKMPDVRRWLKVEAAGASSGGRLDDGAPANRLDRPEVNRHGANIRTFWLRHKASITPSTLDLFLETPCKGPTDPTSCASKGSLRSTTIFCAPL